VQRWQSTVEATARPALRLGEIYFLQHDYDGAASAFGTAAQRARLVHWNDDLSVDQADLDRRAALLAAGRSDEGVAVLRPLVAAGTTGFAQQNATANGYDEGAVSFAAVAYFASEQLADHERETGALHAAIDDYTSALAWMAPDETQPEPDENGPEVAPQSPAVLESGTAVRPEVLYNNEALAYLGLGKTALATAAVGKALPSDLADPAFLMTAGFIADRAGKVSAAARYDRAALQSDPGAFPAANDRAVELARRHDYPGANCGRRSARTAVTHLPGSTSASSMLHTPLLQSLAVAALIMAVSTLLPIGPLDGAHVAKKGVLASAGIVGGALLVGLGIA
jgi:tetratricopeptide (TPR) repeat protein